MTTPTSDAPVHGPLQETAEEEMRRLGITRVPTEYFRFGEYRYAHLSDAIDQARRTAKAG